MNNVTDERIKGILEYTKGELTKDSAAAIICLEDEIFERKCAIDLLKKGELVATYEGDNTELYDSEKFIITTKNDTQIEGETK